MKNSFANQAAFPGNPKWEKLISRQNPQNRSEDIRSDFELDYNRILHTTAYRRLKHKTQVFYSPKNDHICTRIEHVNHVESISYTIAKYFGLNTELTRAIAVAHDLGHSPFGHKGEKILSNISEKDIGEKFWHERNGLNLVDNTELINNYEQNKVNLNLTYAVRDGIISHCGEIDENELKPREEFINLETEYTYPNQYAPYTWEACVVKISDKISYIGRDIEDAITLGILTEDLEELREILKIDKNVPINNATIIRELVQDICDNSSLDKGICFSEKILEKVNKLKEYNYKHIYEIDKFKRSNKYIELLINEIYSILKSAYEGKNTLNNLKKLDKEYPEIVGRFIDWIEEYWDLKDRTNSNLENKILYHMNNNTDYYRAIISFIAGMTDNYALELFTDIIGFKKTNRPQ